MSNIPYKPSVVQRQLRELQRKYKDVDWVSYDIVYKQALFEWERERLAKEILDASRKKKLIDLTRKNRCNVKPIYINEDKVPVALQCGRDIVYNDPDYENAVRGMLSLNQSDFHAVDDPFEDLTLNPEERSDHLEKLRSDIAYGYKKMKV